MKHSAIYYAFLRGRLGEIGALGQLSGLAKARTMPVVDLPVAEEKTGTQLEGHVTQFVRNLPYEDFSDPDTLDRQVDAILESLGLDASQVDLIFAAASLPHMRGNTGTFPSLLTNADASDATQ